MPTLKSQFKRTVDIARDTGYSVQQIRNLERAGVLPPATRSTTGYRAYAEIHLHSALAYRALAAGIGPTEAKKILQAMHTRPLAEALALLDAAHACLHSERIDLAHATRAAESISTEPITDVHTSDSMTVAELATALGIRPSALRHWEAEGLITPDRTGPQGARRYTPNQVRDARVVHQLRAAGYRIPHLRALIPELNRPHRSEDIRSALAARDASLTACSRALLTAAAALDTVVALTDRR